MKPALPVKPDPKESSEKGQSAPTPANPVRQRYTLGLPKGKK